MVLCADGELCAIIESNSLAVCALRIGSRAQHVEHVHLAAEMAARDYLAAAAADCKSAIAYDTDDHTSYAIGWLAVPPPRTAAAFRRIAAALATQLAAGLPGGGAPALESFSGGVGTGRARPGCAAAPVAPVEIALAETLAQLQAAWNATPFAAMSGDDAAAAAAEASAALHERHSSGGGGGSGSPPLPWQALAPLMRSRVGFGASATAACAAGARDGSGSAGIGDGGPRQVDAGAAAGAAAGPVRPAPTDTPASTLAARLRGGVDVSVEAGGGGYAALQPPHAQPSRPLLAAPPPSPSELAQHAHASLLRQCGWGLPAAAQTDAGAFGGWTGGAAGATPSAADAAAPGSPATHAAPPSPPLLTPLPHAQPWGGAAPLNVACSPLNVATVAAGPPVPAGGPWWGAGPLSAAAASHASFWPPAAAASVGAGPVGSSGGAWWGPTATATAGAGVASAAPHAAAVSASHPGGSGGSCFPQQALSFAAPPQKQSAPGGAWATFGAGGCASAPASASASAPPPRALAGVACGGMGGAAGGGWPRSPLRAAAVARSDSSQCDVMME